MITFRRNGERLISFYVVCWPFNCGGLFREFNSCEASNKTLSFCKTLDINRLKGMDWVTRTGCQSSSSFNVTVVLTHTSAPVSYIMCFLLTNCAQNCIYGRIDATITVSQHEIGAPLMIIVRHSLCVLITFSVFVCLCHHPRRQFYTGSHGSVLYDSNMCICAVHVISHMIANDFQVILVCVPVDPREFRCCGHNH
jgi:hypothetical protein